MRARSELLNALGDSPREAPRKNRKTGKGADRKPKTRSAPAAVINGDSHQTFIVEGNLTIVIGSKDSAPD